MLQGEHSAILLTFIKLPFVIKTFVSSIFEWPFYTGFSVGELFYSCTQNARQPLVSVSTTFNNITNIEIIIFVQV